MSRVALAFLVAPLWVPFASTILGAYLLHGQILSGWFAFLIIFSMVTAYAGSIVFGLPAFRLLERYRLISPWVGAVGGFVIGIVTLYALLLLIGLPTGAFDHHGSFERGLFVPLYMVLPTGGVGALVGVTIWFIVRTDKR